MLTLNKTCAICGSSFRPRSTRQIHCSTCVHKPCERCGAKKDTRARFCKKCDGLNRIDVPIEWTRRKDTPIEQVATEVEAFGLLPEKQFAFGYVMGVMFGDGSISKVTDRLKFTRTDGSVKEYSVDSYRPRLSVTSRVFCERFVQEWKTLTGRNASISSKTRTNFDKSTLKGRRDEYSLEIFTVSMRHVLLGRYFAHRKYECEPAFILDLPLETMRGFLHGMIDSEGYVDSKLTDIANKNIEVLNILAAIFSKLGQECTITTYPNQTVSHLKTRTTIYKFGIAPDA